MWLTRAGPIYSSSWCSRALEICESRSYRLGISAENQVSKKSHSQVPARTAPNAFDLGALRDHLAPTRPVQHENWANNFTPPMHQAARQQAMEQRSSSPWQQDFVQHNQARLDPRQAQPNAAPWQVPNQGYRPQFMAPRPQYFHAPPPPPPQQYMHSMHSNEQFAPETFEHPTQTEAPSRAVEETRPSEPLSEPQELLARTARQLLDNMNASSEILRDNPKLAQSQFIQLMRGLGDGEVMVEDGKARIDGEEIGEGAKFVSRPGGDWASAFVEEGSSQRGKEEVHLASTLPALNGEPVFEERMRYGNNALYPDQSAITHPTETRQRPENQRRKSVHFDDAEAYQALGSGVPNNLEEAMRASTSIPGMSSAWEDGGLDLDDFDETSFMNYSGQLRQGTDATVGVGQRENWGELQNDWEAFQQADPSIKARGQMDRYLFQSRNPYAQMGDDADMGRESPTLKVSYHYRSEGPQLISGCVGVRSGSTA
jgi:peroxin-5